MHRTFIHLSAIINPSLTAPPKTRENQTHPSQSKRTTTRVSEGAQQKAQYKREQARVNTHTNSGVQWIRSKLPMSSLSGSGSPATVATSAWSRSPRRSAATRSAPFPISFRSVTAPLTPTLSPFYSIFALSRF